MKREDGMLELTRDEVIYLWQEAHGVPFPKNLEIGRAAEACLLTLGAGKIERMLDNDSDQC